MDIFTLISTTQNGGEVLNEKQLLLVVLDGRENTVANG